MIAISCSWCKRSYHNKRNCFSLARFDDRCDRGVLRELILPPGWLLRLSNHQHSRRHHPLFPESSRKRSKRKYRTFVVKPLPTDNAQSPKQSVASAFNRCPSAPSPAISASPQQQLPIQPLLVFVNPKSGGNKGTKALNTLCWLLNPRQVKRTKHFELNNNSKFEKMEFEL